MNFIVWLGSVVLAIIGLLFMLLVYGGFSYFIAKHTIPDICNIVRKKYKITISSSMEKFFTFIAMILIFIALSFISTLNRR